MMLGFHSGCWGFDFHDQCMSDGFFQSTRQGKSHSVCSELEKVVSEWPSVIAVSLNQGFRQTGVFGDRIYHHSLMQTEKSLPLGKKRPFKKIFTIMW